MWPSQSYKDAALLREGERGRNERMSRGEEPVHTERHESLFFTQTLVRRDKERET